jgi:hypothetical protein
MHFNGDTGLFLWILWESIHDTVSLHRWSKKESTNVTTITISRYRLGCWYRPVQKPCIDWCYRCIHGFWTGLYQHVNNFCALNCLSQILVFNAINTIVGSFSDNFYNSDGKDCNCVPLILQKNYKLKLQ